MSTKQGIDQETPIDIEGFFPALMYLSDSEKHLPVSGESPFHLPAKQIVDFISAFMSGGGGIGGWMDEHRVPRQIEKIAGCRKNGEYKEALNFIISMERIGKILNEADSISMYMKRGINAHYIGCDDERELSELLFVNDNVAHDLPLFVMGVEEMARASIRTYEGYAILPSSDGPGYELIAIFDNSEDLDKIYETIESDVAECRAEDEASDSGDGEWWELLEGKLYRHGIALVSPQHGPSWD